MQHYVAFVHGKPGTYGISFPDFPGCVSGGASVDAALKSGIDALHFHMEGMVEDGAVIPAPSSVEAVRASLQFAGELEDAVITLVPVVTPAGRPVRLNVSLDKALVTAIDEAAERTGQTRSGFLAEGARRLLTGRWRDTIDKRNDPPQESVTTHRRDGRVARTRTSGKASGNRVRSRR